MAINRISGNILQDNLQRGANLSIQGNLVYVDIDNVRLGVNTSATTHTLTVVGNAHVSGIELLGNAISADSGVLELGSNANISITGGANDYVLSTDGSGNLSWISGGNIVGTLGNLAVSNTTISANIANGSITLEPVGTGVVIIDTDTGLVLPVGNTAQQPSPAQTGTVRFNTDTTRIEVYDGTEWDSVAAGVTNQLFSGDGSTLIFTLDRDSTTAATLIMFNGIVQIPTIAYTVTGNLVTFAEAPLSTDTIDVRFL